MKKLLPILGALIVGAVAMAGSGIFAAEPKAAEVPVVEVISLGKRTPDGEVLFVVNLFQAQDGTPLIIQGISVALSDTGMPEMQDSRRDGYALKSEFETIEFSHGAWILHVAPATSSWANVNEPSEMVITLEPYW